MKKLLMVLLSLILLSGCAVASRTVKIEGKKYKTGFYGSLFPDESVYYMKTSVGQDSEIKKIEHELFDMYIAQATDPKTLSQYTVYCAEDQYDDAVTYYSDPENYSYYCILGVDSDTQSIKTIELTDVDTSKFNSLLDFADKSNYDPFDKKHNAKIDKVELPMPDDTKDTRLVFYKQSKDDLFVSFKGTDYYIIGGHLYAVYQYDSGYGEYEKLIAVKVPDEISTYFVEYMKSYL